MLEPTKRKKVTVMVTPEPKKEKQVPVEPNNESHISCRRSTVTTSTSIDHAVLLYLNPLSWCLSLGVGVSNVSESPATEKHQCNHLISWKAIIKIALVVNSKFYVRLAEGVQFGRVNEGGTAHLPSAESKLVLQTTCFQVLKDLFEWTLISAQICQIQAHTRTKKPLSECPVFLKNLKLFCFWSWRPNSIFTFERPYCPCLWE